MLRVQAKQIPAIQYSFNARPRPVANRFATGPPRPTHLPRPPSGNGTKENGGKFASINRPIAGATHDKELP